MKTFVSFLLMTILMSCAAGRKHDHKHDQFTQHYDNSLFQITEKGLFSVEMVVKEHGLKTGMNELDIIIHDKNDRDVIGAGVTVTPWMPEMGHGVFDAPVVTEKGGGLYTVENIILIMSGHWELRVSVKQDEREDKAVFDFPDVKIDRGHEHKTVQPPADLDVSTSRSSDRKIFNVSYQSNLDPIPLNKIHAWTFTLETADGKPVENAAISVDGDMPEHGHGLPTQPEVTEHLGGGKYLVEGMKFSMPGWWIIHFAVAAGTGEDTATFNLFLRE